LIDIGSVINYRFTIDQVQHIETFKELSLFKKFSNKNKNKIKHKIN